MTLLDWAKRLFRRPKPGVGKGKATAGAVKIAPQRPQKAVGQRHPASIKSQKSTASKRTRKAKKRTRARKG